MQTPHSNPACFAVDLPATTGSAYPPEFASLVAGRSKRRLGDHFGIHSFGINLTTLDPGGQSAGMHRHAVQDEFVYVLSGELILEHEFGETLLTAGMCVGFPHGGMAHHLINRSEFPATYLEIGDRQPGDSADYPRLDLRAVQQDGTWIFTHRDGEPY